MRQDYENDWPNLPIKYLVVAADNYIVFLDNENDLDYQTNDAFDAEPLRVEQRAELNQVKNSIAKAECIPTNQLEERTVINFKRQLGEALVRAFEKDYENARHMVEIAEEYVSNRNIEQSRYMYLTSSGTTALIFLLMGFLLWLLRDFASHYIGKEILFVILAFHAGAFGALLSVILRMGKTNLDYHASRSLHNLEGASRIFAGMISGLLVGLSIKAGILFPIFEKAESTHWAMILGGVLAGASERFAPSIIKKLDNVKK